MLIGEALLLLASCSLRDTVLILNVFLLNGFTFIVFFVWLHHSLILGITLVPLTSSQDLLVLLYQSAGLLLAKATFLSEQLLHELFDMRFLVLKSWTISVLRIGLLQFCQILQDLTEFNILRTKVSRCLLIALLLLILHVELLLVQLVLVRTCLEHARLLNLMLLGIVFSLLHHVLSPGRILLLRFINRLLSD